MRGFGAGAVLIMEDLHADVDAVGGAVILHHVADKVLDEPTLQIEVAEARVLGRVNQERQTDVALADARQGSCWFKFPSVQVVCGIWHAC